MDHELEVEIRNPDASVALTRRRLTDVAAAAAKPEVAALDRVEEHRPVDLLGRREGEGGIALEFGQPEVGPERRDHTADEVREDVVCVVQLDLTEVARVPGDVGDQEAGGLRGREHRPLSGVGIATVITIRLAPLDCPQLPSAARPRDRRA